MKRREDRELVRRHQVQRHHASDDDEALAAKLQKVDLLAVNYFGEGGTNSNEFHNGMNFTGAQDSDVFFCRNNGWAIRVPST